MATGLGSTKHHQPMSHTEIEQILQALQKPNGNSWETSERKLFVTGMSTARRGQKEQLSMTLDMFNLTTDSDGVPVIYFNLTLGGTKNWKGGVNASEPETHSDQVKTLGEFEADLAKFWSQRTKAYNMAVGLQDWFMQLAWRASQLQKELQVYAEEIQDCRNQVQELKEEIVNRHAKEERQDGSQA
ncbi:hypothetical protein ABBQ38_006820 [Trebouxia sp. C0009 RCD-2024]